MTRRWSVGCLVRVTVVRVAGADEWPATVYFPLPSPGRTRRDFARAQQ
jgi:hypothetical protein